MQGHLQSVPGNDDVQALRQQAGRWLKTLREAAGLSQRDLAKTVGFEYYTFISQIESGRGRLPSAQYTAFARALGVPVRDFVKTLLRYYDPVTYFALFDEAGDGGSSVTGGGGDGVTELAARLARLEAMMDERR